MLNLHANIMIRMTDTILRERSCKEYLVFAQESVAACVAEDERDVHQMSAELARSTSGDRVFESRHLSWLAAFMLHLHQILPQIHVAKHVAAFRFSAPGGNLFCCALQNELHPGDL